MKHLEQLLARLKELMAVLKAFDDQEEALTAEDIEAMKAATEEIESIESQVATIKAAEAARARAAQPADTPVGEKAKPEAKSTMTTVEKVGVMVFSMARAYRVDGARGAKATFETMDQMGYGEVAREFSAAQQRALNSSSAAAGGVLLPEDMSSEIIDILRPATTFLRGNPRRVSLAHGAYKLPAAATGAVSNWRGEGKAIQISQPTFKDISLVAKFLDAMVPLTNQLIRWSLPDVRAWVERDMAMSMGTELDLAAYFGTGSAHQPLGIANIPGVTTAAALGTTTATIAQIETGARTLELSMEGRNLPMDSAAWVMAPRTKRFLADLRDGNGNRFYPELSTSNPMWRGLPVLSTTQVSITGGVTTDESKVLLVNFGDVFFGEGAGMSFAVSTEASYVSGGVTVSAFQNDLTLIKASMEADVDLRYLEAVAVLTGVRWGG